MCIKNWVIADPFILDAWNHSCRTGNQPVSHRESIIVILPKEGKDIKNNILKTNCVNSRNAFAGKVL